MMYVSFTYMGVRAFRAPANKAWSHQRLCSIYNMVNDEFPGDMQLYHYHVVPT